MPDIKKNTRLNLLACLRLRLHNEVILAVLLPNCASACNNHAGEKKSMHHQPRSVLCQDQCIQIALRWPASNCLACKSEYHYNKSQGLCSANSNFCGASKQRSTSTQPGSRLERSREDFMDVGLFLLNFTFNSEQVTKTKSTPASAPTGAKGSGSWLDH